MNANIQAAIDGTASRFLEGVLMIPGALAFVVVAIAAVWWLMERTQPR